MTLINDCNYGVVIKTENCKMLKMYSIFLLLLTSIPMLKLSQKCEVSISKHVRFQEKKVQTCMKQKLPRFTFLLGK